MWVGNEIDHSPPSGAEVKNEWSYTSAPPVCPHWIDKDVFFFFLQVLRVIHAKYIENESS